MHYVDESRENKFTVYQLFVANITRFRSDMRRECIGINIDLYFRKEIVFTWLNRQKTTRFMFGDFDSDARKSIGC